MLKHLFSTNNVKNHKYPIFCKDVYFPFKILHVSKTCDRLSDVFKYLFSFRLRAREMYATEKWADELTKQAAGKHHIGDFLPPEELKK